MTMVVTFITCSGVSIEQEPVMSEKRMHDSNVILLVEDEQRILRFMSISLKAAGYRVITATTGEQALDLVQSEKPDIVLLDIFLPGMSGLEALRKLRTYSQLPVIIISARDSMGLLGGARLTVCRDSEEKCRALAML
jgi:CheY-like chemotaxis protein